MRIITFCNMIQLRHQDCSSLPTWQISMQPKLRFLPQLPDFSAYQIVLFISMVGVGKKLLK